MGLWRGADQKQGDVDAFCTALLKSADVDQPGLGGLSRTARRLGVPVAGVGAALGLDLIARTAAAATIEGGSSLVAGAGAAVAATGASSGVVSSGVVSSGVVSSGVVSSGVVSSGVGTTAVAAAVSTGALSSGVVATSAVATGAATGAVAGGAVAGGWGAASAILIAVKAVGAGALAGAIGIGAVKLADQRLFSASNSTTVLVEGAAADADRVGQGRFGQAGARDPRKQAGVAELPAKAEGLPSLSVPGELSELDPGLGLGAAGNGVDRSGPAAPAAGNDGSLARPGSAGATPALGGPMGVPGAVEPDAAFPNQGGFALPGVDGLPASRAGVRDEAGLAMRGVGELPSTSAGSFPAHEPVPGTGAGSAPSALRVELALLNQVRSLLQRGLGSEGLRALDQYQARFPNGSLGAEATLLRVEALALAGRRDEALRAAEGMLQRYPRSPHKTRLQELGLLPATER